MELYEITNDIELLGACMMGIAISLLIIAHKLAKLDTKLNGRIKKNG